MHLHSTLFVALAFAPALGAQKPDGVKTPDMVWEKDFGSAHAASTADGKPVVAYFTFET